MRTTQLVAHNGALQCNANRLRCPVNEGTRKPRSDARLTSHTFFESHRLEDLEVLERRLAKLAVGLNREGDEVVAKLVARLAILVHFLPRHNLRRVPRGAVVVNVGGSGRATVLLEIREIAGALHKQAQKTGRECLRHHVRKTNLQTSKEPHERAPNSQPSLDLRKQAKLYYCP